ncbi:putative reverse transcriptase domain-containing protein [Tanacetum coccineum]
MAPGRRPTVNQNPPVNRSTNRNNVDINSGIDTQMLNQLIATRVAEALAAAAVTPAASTQEEKLVVPTLQELGMQYKDSISNVAEGDRVKFAFYTLLDGALTCGITALGMNKAIGKCVVVLKSEGYKLTAYNQPVSRTHPFLPCDVPSRPDGLLERYIVVYLWSIGGHNGKDRRAPPRPANQRGPGSQGGQGSDVTCFGCGEKGHYKNKCPSNGNQGGENQIRGNQQNPQNNQRQNQGNPKVSNQASTNTQGGRRAPGRVYNLCAKAAVKDNNVVNGTFLINNVYASVLFDIGADRSFVSYAFSKYIDIPSIQT